MTTSSRSPKGFPTHKVLSEMDRVSLTENERLRESSSAAARQAAGVARWLQQRSYLVAFLFCLFGVPVLVMGFMAALASVTTANADSVLWPAYVQSALLVLCWLASMFILLATLGWIMVWARLVAWKASTASHRRCRSFLGLCLGLWALCIPVLLAAQALAYLGHQGF